MGRELRLLWQDGWGRMLVLWLPLGMMLLLWWIFSAALVRDLPVGLVDLDKSAMSRQLARQMDASPSLRLADEYASVAEGSRALRGGEIYALVVMPAHLERDARLGTGPRITAWNNGQFVLIAKVIASALAQVVGTLNGQVGVLQALADGSALPGALGQSLPLTGQVTALYNLNSSYAQFLLGAIFPAAWQILLILYGLNALAREDRLGLKWDAAGIWPALGRKFALHGLIGWGWGLLWCYGLYGLLGYPQHGDPWLLALSLGLTSGACVGLGMLFYAGIRDAARAVSMAGALTAPGLAFMGITFPTVSMESFATFWRALLPISHYADIQVAVASHGAGLVELAPQFGALALFWLMVPATGYCYLRASRKEAQC
ncbi:multidrug ABC transporter permease [Aeromonas schubertii]|uniref:ABC transporter permease n=1 Tax=Aeromonas schubertii TaxID=652 RepID=UPI00067EC734|nr:ABC transporter permease [Aeromonas schubertii]KUE80502.1 multidrug ABC transporter permease [Aeromonas schubertii]